MLLFQFLYFEARANNNYPFANDGNLNYYSQASTDSNRLFFSSNSIDFGLVHVNFSDSAILEIKNVGEIEIKSILLELKFPFFVKNDSFFNIFPDSNLKIKLYFAPFEMIQYQDILKIIYVDAESMNSDTLSILLKGNGADARIKYYSNSYSFGDVHLGDKKEFSVPIENMGNIPLLIKSVTTQNISFSIITPIVDQIKSSSIDFIKFQYSPEKINKDSTIVNIYYTDPLLQNIRLDTLVKNSKLILYGKGTSRVPVIYDVSNFIPILKQDCSVQAKISVINSEIVEDSIQIWIRKGGEIEFNCLNYVEKRDSNTYIFKIPGEWITLRGIEYFIEAYDNALNRGRFPSRPKFDYISPPIELPDDGIIGVDYNEKTIELHRGNAQKDYRLISIPIQIDETKSSVFDILSNSLKFQKYDEYDWRCVDYHFFEREKQSRFVYLDDPEFSDFSPGKSFFLIIKKNWQYNQIVCPHGYTVRTDTIYNQIALNKGWNLIADPFNFPIPLRNLYLSVSGSIDSIRKYIGKWDWETASIEPWTGYGIYAEMPETLFINPDLRQSFLPTALKKEQSYHWSISIMANCQEACDDDNIMAISASSSIDYDYLDKPEPPPIGEYIMLTFPHPEWKKAATYFAVDVQPPNSKGNVWNFSVYTNIRNSDVKLNFKNLESVPDNFQVMLICEHFDYIQDLRRNAQFVLNSTTANKSYKFKLAVGDPDFVRENKVNTDFLPKDFIIMGNSPNPFNGATNICYELPDEDKITIYIYNVLGERIKTLKKDENHMAGKYFIGWDGTNEAGQPTGSGIYFCKFISYYQSKTLKMVLIR